jgi:hypothetical protein
LSFDRRWAIWLLPPVLAIHNLEEGIFFPRYLPRVLAPQINAKQLRTTEARKTRKVPRRLTWLDSLMNELRGK